MRQENFTNFNEMFEKYGPWSAELLSTRGRTGQPVCGQAPALQQIVLHPWVVLWAQLLSLLIQVQDLLSYNVHGCRGLDRAPRRVHKHLGYVVPKVDFAVGCDGFVLHELQVLWC